MSRLHRHLSCPLGRARHRGARAGDRGRAERRDAALGDRGPVRSSTRSSARSKTISDLGGGTFAVRIALEPRDGRRRRGPAHQHAVRQHVAAGGRRPARRGISRRRGGGVSAGRNIGLAGLRERAGAGEPRADLLGAQAAGPAPRTGSPSSRRASRAAASTTSRTITGSPTRAYSPFAARCEAVAKALRESSARPAQRALRAEPDRRPRRAARADRCCEERRHRHRDGAADDHGPVEFRAAGRREPRSRVLRASDARRRRAHRAAVPVRQSSSACSAPTRWCSRIMADGSAIRRKPAARSPARRSRDWHGLKPAVPVPAGGMTIDRVGEMLDFYGSEVMLLIGGALLEARERLTRGNRGVRRDGEGISLWLVPRLMRGARARLEHGRARPSFETRCGSSQVAIRGARRFPLGRRRDAPLQGRRARALQDDHPAGAVLRSEHGGRAALLRGRARRLLHAGAPRAHARRADPARQRALPGRRRGEVARDQRSRHRAADDLAPVPRHQGRAARLPLHGQCRARQAATAERRGRGAPARRTPPIAAFLDDKPQ